MGACMQRRVARLLKDHEDKKSIDLMRAVFVEQKMDKQHIFNRDFWSWQNKGHPLKKSSIWVVEDDNGKEIIGQYINWPVLIKINDRELLGGITIDLLIDALHRSKGLFSVLGEQAKMDLDSVGMHFQITFPRREHVHNSFMKKLKWIKIGKLPFLVKMLLVERLQHRICSIFASRQLSGVKDSIRQPHNDKSHSGKTITFKILDKLPEDIDNVWDIAKNEHQIAVVRDRKYLEWRYFLKPNGGYSVIAVYNDNVLGGIIVLKIKKMFSLAIGFIVDILCAPDDELIMALLRRAIEEFQQNRITICGCVMTKNNRYYRSLLDCGFVCVPDVINPRTYTLDAYIASDSVDGKAFLNLDNWFITLGDWDLI